MTETRLSELSGIAQPQISKLLTGVRKRWSRQIEGLCQYANIGIPTITAPTAAEQRLSRALRHAVGNLEHPQATEILARVVEALTPALAALRGTKSSQEPSQ